MLVRLWRNVLLIVPRSKNDLRCSRRHLGYLAWEKKAHFKNLVRMTIWNFFRNKGNCDLFTDQRLSPKALLLHLQYFPSSNMP
eukprot:11964087-Ditylum_brightwellii.AAC.1